MNNENNIQDNIGNVLAELLEDDLLNISVDATGEFHYSLNENGKKIAESILGIDRTEPEGHNA